jgi:hypothetical protein
VRGRRRDTPDEEVAVRAARRGRIAQSSTVATSLAALAIASAVVLSGCASAEDVASETSNVSRPDKEPAKAPPHSDETSPPSASPSTLPEPSTSTKTSSSPTNSPQPPRRERTLPNVVGAIPTFLTPSHNIGCAIGNGQVRCDIIDHVYKPPKKPADCRGDYGQSVAVTETGIAAFICITDSVIDRQAPVLSYGSSSVVGDFGCTSRQSGIRCYYLTSKHGFWLSQDQPVLF